MRRILNDVEARHGSVGEAMDKDGLELTLGVVAQDESEGQALHLRVLKLNAPQSARTQVQRRMDEQRAHIFGQENRAPSRLRTQVLDVKRATVRDDCVERRAVVQERDRLVVGGVEALARSIQVSPARDLGFELTDRRRLCE